MFNVKNKDKHRIYMHLFKTTSFNEKQVKQMVTAHRGIVE